MANTQYLALLRGINVGGGNIIRMTDLKACFEAIKLGNVATFIQSGNVLFETAETDRAALTRKIENALSRTFPSYQARIMLCAHAKLRQIVKAAPEGFGGQPQKYRCDVIFLMQPLTVGRVMKSVSLKPGVDLAFSGPGVLYFSRLSARASQTRLTRLISLPIYQDMTIRNWNTTTRLLALMDARARD